MKLEIRLASRSANCIYPAQYMRKTPAGQPSAGQQWLAAATQLVSLMLP